MLQRGNSGDGCDLASTFCKYDLRKGDLFGLGKGATSEAGKPRYNRCIYVAHVCFYVCCSDCLGICGNVCCIAAVVKNSGFLDLEC